MLDSIKRSREAGTHTAVLAAVPTHRAASPRGAQTEPRVAGHGPGDEEPADYRLSTGVALRAEGVSLLRLERAMREALGGEAVAVCYT